MTTSASDTEKNQQLIIQAAVSRFIRQGVSETSLDDIIEESGLSPDLVKSYFPRKNDVLGVLGAANKALAGGMLKELLAEPTVPIPAEMLGRSAVFFSAGGPSMSIVPQAWGVALHDDEINLVMRGVLGDLQDLWVELAQRMAAEGQLPDGADPEDVGRTLGCMIIGYMVQSLLSDVKPEHLDRGLRALAG